MLEFKIFMIFISNYNLPSDREKVIEFDKYTLGNSNQSKVKLTIKIYSSEVKFNNDPNNKD